MESIVLPEKVVLKLVDSAGKALKLSNVLFRVRAFAVRKNDFDLGPFPTNNDGVATITKSDLLNEAAAHYDSGLMDYNRVETCKPDVRIEAMKASEIDKALEARTRVWTALLRGESHRWTSIEELRNVYRTAANHSVNAETINARWNGRSTEYEYAVITQRK